MVQGLQVEIITRDFNRMLAALAAIDPKIEFRSIILAEAAAIVRTALSRTKSAKVSAIRAAGSSTARHSSIMQRETARRI